MTEVLNQNNILDKHLENYNKFLYYHTIFYFFSTIIFGYLDQEKLCLISLINFLFGGLQGFVIQNFEEIPCKKVYLDVLNVLLFGNVIFNIFNSINNYYYFNFVCCIISLFYITQNKIILDISNNIIMKNNSINQKINNISENIKKFTPEQKKLFKEHLFNQMKEIINLKKELEDKINKKDD